MTKLHTQPPFVLDGYNLASILKCTKERGHPEAKHTCGDYDVIARFEGENAIENAAYFCKAANAFSAALDFIEMVSNWRNTHQKCVEDALLILKKIKGE